eukprot:scpid85431/ scgid23213/ Sugar transporter SWEET1; RAG1-activating protein 1; Solute carrier family 50 member 1
MCAQIRRQCSTQNVIYFPFVACWLNCVFWLKYGILLGDPAMISVNIIGIIFQFAYIFFYYYYASEEQKAEIVRNCFLCFLLAFAVLGYVRALVEDWDTAVSHLGVVCSVFTVLMYGAPLSAVKRVVKTRSTECLPFPLCVANFLASAEWSLYGYFIGSKAVEIANGLGALVAALQLGLFLVYPSRTHYDLSTSAPPV